MCLRFLDVSSAHLNGCTPQTLFNYSIGLRRDVLEGRKAAERTTGPVVAVWDADEGAPKPIEAVSQHAKPLEAPTVPPVVGPFTTIPSTVPDKPPVSSARIILPPAPPGTLEATVRSWKKKDIENWMRNVVGVELEVSHPSVWLFNLIVLPMCADLAC